MKQIDYEEIWLDFLEHYVMPLQEEVFRGYASEVGYIFCMYFLTIGFASLYDYNYFQAPPHPSVRAERRKVLEEKTKRNRFPVKKPKTARTATRQ